MSSRGLTCEELARASCLSVQTIKSIRAGRRSPSVETLDVLARVLGRDPAWLMGWDWDGPGPAGRAA